MAQGYSARDVARLLDLAVSQVRAFAKDGLVPAVRGPRGEYRFRFQDLVLLRTAAELTRARVPRARVRRALRELKRDLPEDRPLTGVRIGAEGSRVVVHDGDRAWNPESGQLHFDFGVAELAKKAAPLARKQAREARDTTRDADEWYDLGCDLEAPAPDEAREAYRRALELEPDHVDAHVNLGRLLHEAGDLAAAEAHYRAALASGDDATAAFNLGVVLEDLGRRADALEAYERAARLDHADAHYNAAELCRALGRHADALRHLAAYRRLTLGEGSP